MDFLSRNVITGVLACALGLVSFPAFAVLDSPNYSWRQTRDGQAYKVYDPQGPHLSNNFTPNSSFAENSAGNGVIETVTPGPLTIDGATGEILNGVSLSRGLTVGDLLDGLKLVAVPDNPIGVAVLTASALAPFLLDAWDAYSSSLSSPVPQSGTSFACGPSTYMIVNDAPTTDSCYAPSGPYYDGEPGVSNTYPCIGNNFPDGSGPDAAECPGGSQSGTYVPYAGPSQPSSLSDWAIAHPNQFSTGAQSALNGSPADQTALANDLANSNAPLSTPIPYGYTIPSPDSSVTGSPTTQTSTDPSTGNTTTTTTTPTYKFSTPTPPQEVQVNKQVIQITQTCTASGSCTSQQITTNSPATQPKLGSFIAPTLSAPGSSVLTPTPYPLNFALPSQSNATCPQPISYTAFGTTFNIPLTPLCSLATNVRPYIESLGAVGAGIVIFR